MKNMFMFRRIGLAVILIFVFLVISACGQEESTETATDASQGSSDHPNVIVTLPFGPGSPGAIPYVIGESLGFYEEEGIDVQVEFMTGRPAEVVGLVAAGQADLGISQPDALVYPLAEGNDQGLVWVFTPYQAPVFGIAVEETSDIRSAKQLENTTVGMTSLGAPFETFMQFNVTADGGDPSTIEAVAVSGSAAMEALKRGEVDAVVGNNAEMKLWAASTGTEIKVLPLPPEVEQDFAAGFVIRDSASEEEREKSAKYLRAALKSAIFAQENPEEAVRLNWELYPSTKPSDIPEEQAMEEAKTVLLETVNQFVPSEEEGWGYISEERWQAYVENQGLSEEISDVTVLYDYSLLKLINNFDEEEVREFARNYNAE